MLYCRNVFSGHVPAEGRSIPKIIAGAARLRLGEFQEGKPYV